MANADEFLDMPSDENPSAGLSADKFLDGDTAEKPNDDFISQAKRKAAIGYRAAVEGLTALPTMIGNIPAATANATRWAADTALGIDPSSPSVPYASPFSEGLDALGVPTPSTPIERTENNVIGSLAGMGSLLGAGKEAVANGSAFLGPKLAEILSSQPKLQAASAVTGALGGSAAHELGAGTGGTVASAIAAGLIPQTAATTIPNLIRNIMRGGSTIPKMQANIDAFAAAGATPSVGQATEARIPRWIESTLSRIPGSSGVMAKKAEQQAEDIGEGVENVASGLAGKTNPTITGMAIKKGVTEDFIPKARAIQKSLYDKFDNYVPPQTQVNADNTISMLNDINAPIKGAENLSKTKLFGNTAISDVGDALGKDMSGTVAKASPILDESGQPFLTPAVAGKKTMPYEALKGLRSRIGEKLSDFQLSSDIPRAQLKRIYGALTQDMQAAAKAAGPHAEAAFNEANQYTSNLHDRIDLLQNVVDKAGGPEKIFQAATAGTREGATTLNAVMEALPEDGKKMVSATIIRRLGIANPSNQNDLGEIFSPNTFLTNWNKLSPEAKITLFGNHTAQFNQDINKIAKVASNIKEGSKVFANPSGTASAATNIAGALGFTQAALTGHPLVAAGLAAGAGGANLLAKSMTNPNFVRWLAQNAEKPVSTLPAALNQLDQRATSLGDDDLKGIAQGLSSPDAQKKVTIEPMSYKGVETRTIDDSGEPDTGPESLTMDDIIRNSNTPDAKQKLKASLPQTLGVPNSFLKEEGIRNKVYRDTKGNRTVGVGFNMDNPVAKNIWDAAGMKEDFNKVRAGQEKISEVSAHRLLNKSYEIAKQDIRSLVPNFDKLGKNQQEAATHLAFQYGRGRLKENLPGVISMLNQNNGAGAAARLLSSDYGKQFKSRAKALAKMLYSDEPYSES